MEWTFWIAFGAISAGLSVALGAFGAHGLRDRLTPESMAVFDTGARYQMLHALALLVVGLLAVKIDNVALRLSGAAFVAGILLFSGSLYALALTQIRSFGMVTPLGGLAFLVGWGAMAWSVIIR